jgi:hypothetical protein
LVNGLLTLDALRSTKKLKGRQQELMTQQKNTDNQVTFSLCFPVVWGGVIMLMQRSCFVLRIVGRNDSWASKRGEWAQSPGLALTENAPADRERWRRIGRMVSAVAHYAIVEEATAGAREAQCQSPLH